MKLLLKCKFFIMTLIILVICFSPIMLISKDVLLNKNYINKKYTNVLLYETDFETEEYSKFLKRGSTTELSISNESFSGKKSLLISKRKEEWSGVQIDIDSFATPNVEYLISAKVKSKANDVKLSYKYKDKDGNIKYILLDKHNGNDWLSFDKVKFTFYEDMEEVYLYFSGTEGYDIYIDDFSIEFATIDNTLPSLKELYSKFFNVGVGVDNSEFESLAIKQLILNHFDTIAIANELKPDYVLDKAKTLSTGVNDNPQVDISNAKTILEFCEQKNISLRGHTITWYDQTPTWFFKENYDENAAWVDEETMKRRLENYIKNLFQAISEEYPNLKISAWDVANEAWLDDGSSRAYCVNKVEEKVNGLMCSPWTTIFNDNSYIEYAFTYARKYASKETKLFYADFHNYVPKKREAIYNMALKLREKNLIDGIALHSHLDYNFANESEYKEHLNQYNLAFELYKQTGLDIHVSELDISIPNKDYDLQAKFYSDYMDILLKHHKNITYLGFWGITDDNSWKQELTPNLFFRDYTAKPAFYALINKEEVKQTADLEAIVIDGVLLENFNSNILTYDITVKNKSKVKIDAIAKEQNAKIDGASIYELEYGLNQIKINVTTINGTKKEYILNITRQDSRSSINTLETLSISSVNINFKADVNVYNVEVENNIDKVTIESTLSDKKSSYIEDFSNKTFDLKIGINTFIIQVKAENESINKYTINIIRKDIKPIYNTKISIENKIIDFNSYKDEYVVYLGENEKELKFNVQVPDESYIVEIEGNSELENGKIVKVKITNNEDTLEYRFKIVKEVISDLDDEVEDNENDKIKEEQKENNTEDSQNKSNSRSVLFKILIFSIVILMCVIMIIFKKIK